MMKDKSNTKRLFLFAGYDRDGIIDDTLVYYASHLAKFGDIVLVMDSDCTESELKKIKPYCRYISAVRHSEYDFGSYKRAYIWAVENVGLENYELVYMVNDSVYGPFFDMKPYFEKMESGGEYGAFGMVDKTMGHAPHIQSWFIGMRPIVFMSGWFDEFIKSVCHQPSKNRVAIMYETGFTQLLKKQNIKYFCLFYVLNRGVYKRIKSLYKRGMPFMKKVTFLALEGALGYQIRYVLKHISNDLSMAIINNARRVYGAEYTDKVLRNGYLISIFTKAKHIIKRIISGKI